LKEPPSTNAASIHAKTHHTAAVFASHHAAAATATPYEYNHDSFKDIKEIVNARVSQKVNNPKH
jgi:hypothetical protein